MTWWQRWKRERDLKKLWREAERMGVGRIYDLKKEQPHWAFLTSSACFTKVGVTGVFRQDIYLRENEREPVFSLAHELGHAAAFLDDSGMTWTTCQLGHTQIIRERLNAALEPEAWDLGEAILKRLGIRYDRAALWAERQRCLKQYADHLRDFEARRKRDREARKKILSRFRRDTPKEVQP